jgi:hypothetical protein
MTTITLPAELEDRLAAEARKRGTTTEKLALDCLAQLFVWPMHAQHGPVQEIMAPAMSRDDQDAEERPWRGICAVEALRHDELSLRLHAESPPAREQPVDILWDPHRRDD